MDFDCGDEEQNDYLRSQAREDQEALIAVTYLAYVKGIAAAYFTLCMDSLQLGHEKPEDTSRGELPAQGYERADRSLAQQRGRNLLPSVRSNARHRPCLDLWCNFE